MQKKIKRFLNLLFLFVSIFIFSLEIKGIDQFPNTIQVKSGDLTQVDGWHVFKKSATGTGIKSKTMCVSFWKNEPQDQTCSKANWNSNKSKNNAAAAAIGSIIQKARSKDNSMTWENYVYAEVAINKFIYDNNVYGYNINTEQGKKLREINNVNNATSILSHVRNWINDANNIYKKLSKIYDDPNLYKIVFDQQATENDNIVTAKFHCELEGKTVSCPKLSIAVYEDSEEEANKYTKKENSDKSITIKSDFSSYKDLEQIKATIVAKIYNSYTYAQRYSCGNNQSVTPNTLSTQQISAVNSSKITWVPKTNETCDSRVTSSIKEGIYQNQVNNLFDTYSNGNILNVQNPSCTNPSGTIVSDCDHTQITNTWTKKITSSNITNRIICSAKFDFINEANKTNIGNKGELIYYNESGMLGTALVEYACYDPSNPTDDRIVDNYPGKSIQLNTIAPDITLELMGKKIVVSGTINSDGIQSETGVCTSSGDVINCSKYETMQVENYNVKGIKFSVNITYRYPEGSYSIKTINGIKQKGILADSSKNENSANITFELNNTAYESIDTSSNELSCKFYVSSVENPNVLYRTINTSSPFLNYKGDVRKTGSNWCQNTEEQIDDTEQIEEESYNKCAGILKLPGDINDNYEWDEDDIDQIQKIIDANEYVELADVNHDQVVNNKDIEAVKTLILKATSTSLGDVNLDGVVDIEDANILSRYILALETPPIQFKIADVNGDCYVNTTDVMIINAYALGVRNCLGACHDYMTTDYDESLDNLKTDKNNTWCSGDPNVNSTIKTYISDRPDADGVITSSKNTGKRITTKSLYSFVLTPQKIKDIRRQTSELKGDYTNFKGTKDSNGKFISEFVEQIKKDADTKGECSKVSGYCDIDSIIDSMKEEGGK